MQTENIDDKRLQQLEKELKEQIKIYLAARSPNRTYGIADNMAFLLFDDDWRWMDKKYAMKEDLLSLMQLAADAKAVVPGSDSVGMTGTLIKFLRLLDSLDDEYDEALIDLSIIKNGDIPVQRLNVMIKDYQIKTEMEKLGNKLQKKNAV
ncbi:hypothetical protein [Ferruginibacter sp.]